MSAKPTRTADTEPRYTIWRYYQRPRPGGSSRIVRTGLTLAEAQAHCNDPETSTTTATSAKAKRHTARFGPWFDGYTERG